MYCTRFQTSHHAPVVITKTVLAVLQLHDSYMPGCVSPSFLSTLGMWLTFEATTQKPATISLNFNMCCSIIMGRI